MLIHPGRLALFVWALPVCALAWQNPDPTAAAATQAASRAYESLRQKDYAGAIAGFRQAIDLRPTDPTLRKDLAYTLLKTGEREEARDLFLSAWKLAATDGQTGLEYAYLCFETKQPREARLAFAQLRSSSDAKVAAQAAQAFQNIDQPLAESIARWTAAVAAAPEQWSAHEELARLLEQRDDLAAAAQHFLTAWTLRMDHREYLLDLGRVATERDRPSEANAAHLAASYGPEPRIADTAQDRLPKRYPYLSEFEDALKLDPDNLRLRREYAFFLLQLKRNDDAVGALREQLRRHPNDDVSQRQLDLLLHPDRPPVETRVSAKVMGVKSLEKSYLADAVRYLTIAHEEDPGDAEVMLDLGRAANLQGHDDEALRWFNIARRSGDSPASREASRLYRALHATAAGVHITAWALPFYSSRWESGLGYAQVKAEWKFKRLALRPYLSVRLLGDTSGRRDPTVSNPLAPAYLSETALVPAFGLALPWKYGLTFWGEAGEAISYLGRRSDTSLAKPDLRGGAAWGKGWGHLMGSTVRGAYVETNADAVFVSRYANDVLMYVQTRTGYTFAASEHGTQLQALMNWNATFDRKGEPWANYVEAGPGIRLRVQSLAGALFRADYLRGSYLKNRDNVLRPNYWDFRAGLWYAITR